MVEGSEVVRESPTVEVEGLPLVDVFETERWRLEVMDGPEQGRRVEFSKRIFRIGGDPLNDLVLTDRTVSRRHCELLRHGGQCKLVDLSSTNGTFLNDLKVGEVYLSHGAVFRLGQTRLRFTVEVEQEPVVRPRTDRYGDIIGSSPGLKDVFAIMDKVAPSELSVVIEGETGTGKELIARALHQNSRRAEMPLVVFDCSAFPATLLESELFGHEKGAFSGATYTHRGVFERANGGTIFFDELAEMDVEFQPKFLRVLETGEFRRVGGERTIKVDVRVVAATNRRLDEMIALGTFRRDLFYRLAKVRFRLPPLRERREDVALLAEFFLDQIAPQLGSRPTMTAQAVEALQQHAWPGNIREMRNVIERAATMCSGHITADYLRRELGQEEAAEGEEAAAPWVSQGGQTLLRAPQVSAQGDSMPLREAKDQLVSDFERQYLEQLLEKHAQNVSAAAREAQVDRRHFYRLLKKYDLMK
jgi:transcriptional regulator with GAF, ATPase, and Fis domain